MITIILGIVGGLLYGMAEVLFRGYTHWTMLILGGACFVMVGTLNEKIISWEMPIWLQIHIGAWIITIMEFVTGCIVNLWFGWQVWDYSDLPFNLLGQICPQYFLLWHLAALVCIFADDYIRYAIGSGKKPQYEWR